MFLSHRSHWAGGHINMITMDLNEIAKLLKSYNSNIGDEQGDHVLNPHNKRRSADEPLKPAAVLVPLVNRDAGPTVLFTQRTDHLDHHPGQVSFPGGHVDKGDTSAEETALRETDEEVGIHRRHIQLIGRIDTYLTSTGFSVTPVVGLIEPPFEINPDPVEVAEVFEVPLSFLFDAANHSRVIYSKDNEHWDTYDMPYNRYRIWGVTAGMFRNFYEIIAGDDAQPATILDRKQAI
jgi:8-oxo-dGTP pyrophosphatase MutT (NUDIX family)